MRDYGMFSKQGNAAVQKIVDEARALTSVGEYGYETVWDWACHQLADLSNLEGCEEATDTAVRDAVYDAII